MPSWPASAAREVHRFVEEKAMAAARVIDGKAIAAEVRRSVAAEVEQLKNEKGLTPGLAVVLVGEDPASQVYVRNKARQTTEAGMRSFEHRLPASTSEAELLSLIDDLNRSKDMHGILVQLPLPPQIETDRKSTRLNSSHVKISYAVFCLKK